MRVAAALVIILALALPSAAQEIVFVIRHAEKDIGDDPALTEKGRRRAAAWADMLRDAGLHAVITTDAQRTRQTGSIIAEALDLPSGEADRADIVGLTDLLTFDHEDDRVLVVAHAETISGIVAALGVENEIAIEDNDFGNLFIVTPGASTLRLRLPEEGKWPAGQK